MAEDLGKKLLGETLEVPLDEILDALRLETEDRENADYFGLPPLNNMLNAVVSTRSTIQTRDTRPSQPIIELMSPSPGHGIHELLYFLCAKAVLPRHLGGRQACVVVVDMDGSFANNELAAAIRFSIQSHRSDCEDITRHTTVSDALKHVHIFRPQSLASTAATLGALPTYLFDANKHYSADRQLAFITLSPITAFYWQDRAETEDAAFYASTSAWKSARQPTSAYSRVGSSLKDLTKVFNCPAIITSDYLFAVQQSSQGREALSFRPMLPAPFTTLPSIRVVIQKIPIRKFPMGITVEEALRQAPDRQKAVDESKFECRINEWGIDEGLLRELEENGGMTFRFQITEDNGLIAPEEDF